MLAKGQRRKQQIIDTAKEMFIEIGFQSTHIGNVCEKLNIARGTVYQYFGNKREILYAILESIEEKIDDILDVDDLRDFLKTDPSQDGLLQFVKERILSIIRVVESETIVIKLIYKDIVGIDEEVICRVNKFIEFVSKVIKRDINEIKKDGFYRDDVNSDIASLMIVGSFLIILYKNDRNDITTLDEDKIDSIIGTYLYGVISINK